MQDWCRQEIPALSHSPFQRPNKGAWTARIKCSPSLPRTFILDIAKCPCSCLALCYNSLQSTHSDKHRPLIHDPFSFKPDPCAHCLTSLQHSNLSQKQSRNRKPKTTRSQPRCRQRPLNQPLPPLPNQPRDLPGSRSFSPCHALIDAELSTQSPVGSLLDHLTSETLHSMVTLTPDDFSCEYMQKDPMAVLKT